MASEVRVAEQEAKASKRELHHFPRLKTKGDRYGNFFWQAGRLMARQGTAQTSLRWRLAAPYRGVPAPRHCHARNIKALCGSIPPLGHSLPLTPSLVRSLPFPFHCPLPLPCQMLLAVPLHNADFECMRCTIVSMSRWGNLMYIRRLSPVMERGVGASEGMVYAPWRAGAVRGTLVVPIAVPSHTDLKRTCQSFAHVVSAG